MTNVGMLVSPERRLSSLRATSSRSMSRSVHGMSLACMKARAREQVGHQDVVNITMGVARMAVWICAALTCRAGAEVAVRAVPDDGTAGGDADVGAARGRCGDVEAMAGRERSGRGGRSD